VLAYDRVVLLELDALARVRLVLPGDVSEPGAGGALELDLRPLVVLRHLRIPVVARSGAV
jgi:hypothetical protein